VNDPGWVDHDERLPSRVPDWTGEPFAAELREWIGGHVGDVDLLVPVKQRVWATVWCAETGSHRFYAKQNCSRQSFEAALVATLSDLAPRRVVPVTAADRERGLLLTPDQGRVFGEAVEGEDLDAWSRVLAAGSALQREVADAHERLTAAGVTTLSPDQSRSYAEQRLDELA